MKLEPVHGSPTMPPLKLTNVLGHKQQQQQNLHQHHQQQSSVKMEEEEEDDGLETQSQSQPQRPIAGNVKEMDTDATGNEEEFENDAMYENGEDEATTVPEESVLSSLLKSEKQSQPETRKLNSTENGEIEEESSSSLVGSGSGGSGGGGASKKKGQRKKRSMNWEEAERSLLVDIIKPKVDFIENRSVDTKNIKTKRLSWIQISKQFNSLNFRQRSLEQIQVQWRSMKNSAKREFQVKHPKVQGPLEGLQMLEFMEEMQKELVGATRSQTRSLGVQQHKKESMEIDDEDTPLAALPNSTLVSNSGSGEDTLPSSTMAAILSPPNSTEIQDIQINGGVNKKKGGHQTNLSENLMTQSSTNYKSKRQKSATNGGNAMVALNNLNGGSGTGSMSSITTSLISPVTPSVLSTSLTTSATLASRIATGNGNILSPTRNHMPTLTTTVTTSSISSLLNSNDMKTSTIHLQNTNNINSQSSVTNSNLNSISTTPPMSPSPTSAYNDEKYKRQLFDIIKRSRLAEIDFIRKEHEQKLRFEQEEQELKMRHMCELHEQRMRLALNEHEMRMQAYTIHIGKINVPQNEQLDI